MKSADDSRRELRQHLTAKGGGSKGTLSVAGCAILTGLVLCGCATPQPPLHSAIIRGNTDAALKLVQEGADVNARDSFAQTPLWLAAVTNQLTVARALLAAGANPNAESKLGLTRMALKEHVKHVC